MSQHASMSGLKQFALFELGFRPFFLLGSLFAVVSVVLWLFDFVWGWPLPVYHITPIAWHGHEMLFGYTLAVIAGFLLTAVRNWTSIPTARGGKLLILTCLWLLARILPLCDSPVLFFWGMIMDMAFMLGVIGAIFMPIMQVRQWRQMAIIAKLGLLLLANLLYYLGVYHVVDMGISWGLFSAVYLIMALIFTLARRVMPFFIERGVGYPVTLKNTPFIDRFSLLILAVLWVVDVFLQISLLTAILSLILAVIHSIRLRGWYTPGIWHKPLLWVLFGAYASFILGFVLQALNYFQLFPATVALHAFTYGGIGMMTIGMMARVALGHTGRDINQPPRILPWVFGSLAIGTIIRVLGPVILPEQYLLWIALSQMIWIAAFAAFFLRYFHIWIRPRIDGLPG